MTLRRWGMSNLTMPMENQDYHFIGPHGGGGSSWDPQTNLGANLRAWLKADSGVSNGGTTWTDAQTTNAYNYSSGTLSWSATGSKNSNPAVTMAAAGDKWFVNGTNFSCGSGNIIGCIAVFQMTTSTGSFGGILSLRGASETDDFIGAHSCSLLSRHSNGTAPLQADCAQNSSVTDTGNITASTAQWRIATLVSGTNMKMWGSATASAMASIGSDQTGCSYTGSGTNSLYVGNRYTSNTPGGFAFDGTLSELIVFTQDISSDIASIDTYLTGRWGT